MDINGQKGHDEVDGPKDKPLQAILDQYFMEDVPSFKWLEPGSVAEKSATELGSIYLSMLTKVEFGRERGKKYIRHFNGMLLMTSPTSFPNYLKQVAKRSFLGFERVHTELLRRYGDHDVQGEKKQTKDVARRKKMRHSKRRIGSIVQESFRSYVEPSNSNGEPAVKYTANTKRNLYSQSKLVTGNATSNSLYCQPKTENVQNVKPKNGEIIDIQLKVEQSSRVGDRKPMKPVYSAKDTSQGPLDNKDTQTLEKEENTVHDISSSLNQNPLYDVPPTSEKDSLYDIPPFPTQDPLYDVLPSVTQDCLYDILPSSVRKVLEEKDKELQQSQDNKKDNEQDYIPMAGSSPRARIDSDERDYANVQEVIQLKKPTKAASFPGDYVNCAAEYKGSQPNSIDTIHNKLAAKESNDLENRIESIPIPNNSEMKEHAFPDGARYAVVDKHQRNKTKTTGDTDKTADRSMMASDKTKIVIGKTDYDIDDTLVYDYVDCEGMEDVPVPQLKNKPIPKLKNGQTLRQRLSQMSLDTADTDSSYVVMMKQMGTKKHPEPKFYSFSVEEVVDVLNNCAMPQLAKICLQENLDGDYFSQLQMEDFCDEPFNMSWFYIGKLYRIINGWRPKRY